VSTLLLKDKVAFIAGGTSGINLEIARRFAAEGACVFVMSRDPAKVRAAIDEIRGAYGGRVDGIAADVRDYEQIVQAVEACATRFGKLTTVISGAAGNFVAPAASMSSNAFNTVLQIDLLGTFNVFRAAHGFLAEGDASLIAISAVQATTPMPGQAHVCAAKAGIEMLVKVLALEWGPAGIRVNAISPGPIGGTEGMRRLTPNAQAEAALLAGIPLGRYGRAEEVAEAATWLSSDRAGYVTGSTLTCDGGNSLSGGAVFANALAAGRTSR